MWDSESDLFLNHSLCWALYHIIYHVMSLSRYNQVNAISLACSTGVEGCKELTTGWFKEWMSDPAHNKYVPICVSHLSPSLVTAVIAFNTLSPFTIVPGLVPTWRPQCTAVRSQQEEWMSGTLPGPCLRMPPSLQRLISSCMLCHAPNSPGCSTGQ